MMKLPASARKTTGKCGVYCLLNELQVVYVGSTTNLTRRLYGHRRNGILFDDVTFTECDPQDRWRKEAESIKLFGPKLNSNAVLQA